MMFGPKFGICEDRDMISKEKHKQRSDERHAAINQSLQQGNTDINWNPEYGLR